jgi:WD40 repeat protein
MKLKVLSNKIFKYLIGGILPFLFIGCAAQMAILKNDLKSYIPNNQTFISHESEKKGIYLQIDKKWNKNTARQTILTKDKRYLINVSSEKYLIITDIKRKKFVKKITGQIGPGPKGKFLTIALSPDEKYLVAGGYFAKDSEGESGGIRIYDFKTFKLLKVIKNNQSEASGLDFSSDGKYLVSTEFDKKITIWNVSDFSFKSEIKLDSVPYFVKLVKDKDTYKIFTLEEDNNIRLYDLVSAKLLREQFVGIEINGMAIGKSEVAVGTLRYKYVDIYDFNLNRIDKININNGVRDLDYSKDGRYLSIANAYDNAGVNVYDRFNKNKIVKKSTINVYTLKFIDNKNFLTIDSKKDLNILSIGNQKNKKILSGEKIIYSLGFADNKLAFSHNSNSNVNDFEKKGYFNTYFDFEKFKIVKGNINHKVINNKSEEYSLEVKKIKGSALDIPYLTLQKNGLIKEVKQYSDYYFNTYAFYDDFVVTGGKVNYILSKEFKEIAILASSGSLTMRYSRYKNLLISLNNESIMEFWDLKDLKDNEFHKLFPKLSLYINENNEWVMWTPEGYFNSSENGYKNIGFHINQGYDKDAKWVEIEKLYDHFYRPDLVKLVLDGKDITPYTKGLSYIDVLKNPAPDIKITRVNNKRIKNSNINHYKNKIKLEFNVKQVDKGGVGLIRIYQEGKLVKTIGEGKINRASANVAEDLKTEKLAKKAKDEQEKYLAINEENVTKSMNGTIDNSELIKNINIKESSDNSGLHKILLPLKAGKNQIEIEAFNKTNTVASIREKFTVNAKIKKRKPVVYAIIAGVNKFQDTKRFKNLKYSENDARAIRDMLKLKIREKVVPTLLLGKDFTKENLYKAIKKIKSKARLEDKIVFYVSTHGKASRGNLYIVPQNNKFVRDFIKFENMFKQIQSISALDQVFIIDACESGKAKDIVSSIYDSKASVLAKQSGVHVLLATSKGTFAFEHPNPKIKHGVFTNNILKALEDRNTDKNRDKKISVIELSKVLRSPKYTTKHQYPVIRNVGQDTKIRDF